MRKPIVEDARRLDREARVEVIVDERRRQRQDGAVDAEAVEPRYLTIELEEGGVEIEGDAADAQRHVLALGALDLDGELVALLDEAEERVRHEMAVHVGDHGHSPR